MKIAIIGPAHPFRGGLAAYNERMAKQFMEEGHEVNIYTFTVQYPSFLFPGKTQYSTEPAPQNLNIERAVNSTNPVNWLSFGNRIKKERPDLVIVRFWLPFMGPCFGTILRQIKKNKHTKIISIIDNMIPHEKRSGDSIFTKYFVTPLDAFLAMSKSVMKDIDVFDTKKPRVFSLHPIYDNFGKRAPRDTALRKLGFDPNPKYMMFFGLIRDYKGLDLLIESFADSRFRKENIKLIIAGEYYSDKEKYQTLIEKYKLENDIIQIDKYIPDSEVADFFNGCDLVVQPYKTATQSGVTQIAYHFHKPMIVTNVGGLGEMCPHEKVGYVVNPDKKEIADAILRFFNKTDIDIMTKNIEEEKKRYDWNILTNNIINLYKRLQSEYQKV